MKYSIRFPLVKERTGYRKGPRYRRTVDCSGLTGAAACAARMISSAIISRDGAKLPSVNPDLPGRIARLGMRNSALWARVFAGHISQDDPRVDEVMSKRAALVRQYCASVVGGAL